MHPDSHLRVLATAYAALPLLGFLAAGILLATGALGTVAPAELTGRLLEPSLMAGVLWAAALLNFLNIVAAVALFRRTTWARPYVLALGFLNLANYPLGTALGGYTIWLLSKDRVRSALAA